MSDATTTIDPPASELDRVSRTLAERDRREAEERQRDLERLARLVEAAATAEADPEHIAAMADLADGLGIDTKTLNHAVEVAALADRLERAFDDVPRNIDALRLADAWFADEVVKAFERRGRGQAVRHIRQFGLPMPPALKADADRLALEVDRFPLAMERAHGAFAERRRPHRVALNGFGDQLETCLAELGKLPIPITPSLVERGPAILKEVRAAVKL